MPCLGAVYVPKKREGSQKILRKVGASLVVDSLVLVGKSSSSDSSDSSDDSSAVDNNAQQVAAANYNQAVVQQHYARAMGNILQISNTTNAKIDSMKTAHALQSQAAQNRNTLLMTMLLSLQKSKPKNSSSVVCYPAVAQYAQTVPVNVVQQQPTVVQTQLTSGAVAGGLVTGNLPATQVMPVGMPATQVMPVGMPTTQVMPVGMPTTQVMPVGMPATGVYPAGWASAGGMQCHPAPCSTSQNSSSSNDLLLWLLLSQQMNPGNDNSLQQKEAALRNQAMMMQMNIYNSLFARGAMSPGMPVF